MGHTNEEGKGDDDGDGEVDFEEEVEAFESFRRRLDKIFYEIHLALISTCQESENRPIQRGITSEKVEGIKKEGERNKGGCWMSLNEEG